MIAQWIRKVFGSVRLFVFLLTLLADLVVVAVDLVFGLKASAQLYNSIVAISGLTAVFMWKDTSRPAGYGLQNFSKTGAP